MFSLLHNYKYKNYSYEYGNSGVKVYNKNSNEYLKILCRKIQSKGLIVFKWNTHIIITIVLFIMFKEYIPIEGSLIVALLLLAFGSLLPDIDHPKSKLGRYFPLGRFMKHRAWYTHSIIGAFLLPLPFLLIGKSYYIIVALGCLSHVMADTLTPGGTKILFPLVDKRLSLNIAKTGGVGENIIIALGSIYILFNIIQILLSDTLTIFS